MHDFLYRYYQVNMLDKSFYFSQEFWTMVAVVVALFVPFIVHWLDRRPKNSKLMIKAISIINQDQDVDNQNMRKLLHVARIVIKNEGKFTARLVEPYIDKIINDNEEQEDFIPVPLSWTHLNTSRRDIYPNQTVYLDLFNHIFDPEYVSNRTVEFAVTAGHGVDSLSKMAIGNSEINIKLYQDSGQVDEAIINTSWNGQGEPRVSFKK